jgi:ketosteroid isomerase-like protein
MAVVLAAPLPLACGGDGDETLPERGPTSPLADPAANEASPEAPPAEPSGGTDLAESDEAAVREATDAYIAALNAHEGERVCESFVEESVLLVELPPGAQTGTDCAKAVGAAIGRAPRGGAPAWRRTTIREVTAVSVGEGRARVTATVTHDFTDRNYVSIEEDIVYIQRAADGRWLIAKPSGTFYRAVGYPEPPLRALTPP